MVTMFTYGIAYILRFNFSIGNISLNNFLSDLLLTTTIYLAAYLSTRSYEGIIRHSGLADLIRLVKASGFAVITCLTISFISRLTGDRTAIFPASISIIHFALTITLLVFSRYGIKVLFYQSSQTHVSNVNVLIYGAGRTGIKALHALTEDPRKKYSVVGFIDDDRFKKDKAIEGVKIFSPDRIDDVLKKFNVGELIISTHDLNREQKNKIVEFCLDSDILVKYLPPMEEWIHGKLNTQQIRNIKIEDLLEREPIKIETNFVKGEIENRVILVTGAAGSIGSEIVRQLLFYKPFRLILLDQAESALYDLEMELFFRLKAMTPGSVEFIVCDITNTRRLTAIFKQYRPDIVFHAAAYKHVPMMEINPVESVHVNVFGTKNLVDLSVDFEVSKFVMISTDKAVNPTNIMGATKRAAEIYVQDKAKNPDLKTAFITTRFGNVLGSNGSVITLFKKQIESGGPVTITHPEVTRYFMTISEACQLVLEAAAMGKGGEIFLFDMGECVKIFDLAKKMVLLSGLTPGKDIDFIFTGLRPGEKLYEELLNDAENSLPTHHQQIMIARVIEYDSAWVKYCIDHLWNALLDSNTVNMVLRLKEMIPEYKSQNSVYEQLDSPAGLSRVAVR